MKARDYQSFVEQLDELTPVQREALLVALKLKASSADVLAMIEARFAADPACGHCASKRFGTWGHANDLRRYKCKDCGRTINALTGTALAQMHCRDKWLDYASAMADGLSLRKAAERCDKHLVTSFRRRRRFLKTPKGLKAATVTGIVEADETFIRKSSKGLRKLMRRARNQSGSFTLTYEVPASQLVAAGLYQDLNAEVVVANVTTAGQINNAPALRRRVSMPIQATVVKACQLGTPTAPNLAFAATDIPNGLPNEGTTKSTQMTANCTAPTRVRLTGQALQPVIATGARPNFDNFINYRAVGTFGAASATLTTTPSAQNVDSAGYNGAANATVSGTVNVDVNLKKAQPIIAGNYSGVLTVTLDPNL